jgi:oligoendopeptidase F
LLRRYLIAQNKKDWMLDILDETFNNFHRYTFMFPILSRLEHEMHEAMLNDQPITADFLNTRCAELFSEAYSDAIEIDSKRIGIRWSQFGHFFVPYYFYTYTLGIAAGNVLAEKIYQGDLDLRDRYLNMLASGNSKTTPELFAMVGIDLTNPELIRGVFKILNEYLDILETF